MKVEFSASLLQSCVTWSFRNPSNIMIWCSRTFVIMNVNNVLNIFSQHSLMNRKFKRTEFILEINAFTATLNNWMHPCWFKVLISLKKDLLLTDSVHTNTFSSNCFEAARDFWDTIFRVCCMSITVGPNPDLWLVQFHVTSYNQTVFWLLPIWSSEMISTRDQSRL